MTITADITYYSDLLVRQTSDLRMVKSGLSPQEQLEDQRLAGLIDNIKLHIEEFQAIQFNDPRKLGIRLTKVKSIIRDLDKILKLADEACQGEVENLARKVKKAFTRAKTALEALEKFFNLNEDNTKYIDRVLAKIRDDDRKQKGFVKHKTKRGLKLKYGLSKGVVNANEKSHFRHDDVWGHRLQRDFEGIDNREYLKWLNQKLSDDKRFLPNSPVFNITCFLLEKNKVMLGTTSAKFPDYRGARPKSTGTEDHSPSRLYFEQRKLYGLYTLVDKKSGHSLAYPGMGRKSNVIVYLPVHTFDTPVHENSRVLKYPYRKQESINKCETPMSMKYVMRHDHLYMGLTPHSERRSHAEESGFKSIQSAGAIVAYKGTILVIDNASGHYQPGWELLVQAVQKAKSERAFGPDALVGVVARPNIYYFPVQVFLDFADRKFKQLDNMMQWKNRAIGMKIPAVTHQSLINHLKAQHFGKMSGSDLTKFLSTIKPR